MAIILEDTVRTTYPVMSRSVIGEVGQFALIKWEQRDRLKENEATGQFEKMSKGLRPDGTEAFRQEMVLHCIVMPGTNMEATSNGKDFAPKPGERVRIILKAKAFGNWIDARKKHRNNKLAVGDVILTVTEFAQQYDQKRKPLGPPIYDQQEALAAKAKGKGPVGFYGPLELAEPTDPRWVDAAEHAYLVEQRAEQEAKAITLAEPAPAGGGWDDSEEIPY